MINRKLIFINLFFAILVLFGAQVQAARFGWRATVNYTNSVTVNISASSHSQCERKRRFAINNPPFGVSYVSATSCGPIVEDFEELIHFEQLEDWRQPVIPWPGPVCLNCPYLSSEMVERIYPDHYKQVIQLMDKYNIDEYNQQLLKLQDQFGLEGFEEEMFNLEMQINP